MRVYIDKENIESLVKGRKNHPNLFDEFVRYIKKGLPVHYNFSKDVFNENQYIRAWLSNIMGDGVSTKSDYCPPENVFPSRPVKTNFLSGCG